MIMAKQPWIYSMLCIIPAWHMLICILFTVFGSYEHKLAYASYGDSRGVAPQPTPSWNWCSMHEWRCTTESNASRIIQERIIIPLPLICVKASLRGLSFEDTAGGASCCLPGALQESSGDE